MQGSDEKVKLISLKKRRKSAEYWIAETKKWRSIDSSDLFDVMELLLTQRQLQVMQFLNDGMNMAEISRKLLLSQGHIRQIRAVICRHIKLGRSMINLNCE